MTPFRLQLVGRHGARIRQVRPFDQEAFWAQPHEQASLVFTAEKKQMFILTSIIGCGSLKSGLYWRFTDAVGTDQDAADNGIPLTDAGRWRSRATLAYLVQESLGSVPNDIQEEIAKLVDSFPQKREDELQRPSSTWRKKWPPTAPDSKPPSQQRPG